MDITLSSSSRAFEAVSDPCSGYERNSFRNNKFQTHGTDPLEHQEDGIQLTVSAQSIYNEDSRKDQFESFEKLKNQWAISTLALIEDSKIQMTEGGLLKINAKPHSERNNLCPGTPFSNQPSAAFCSGFLIQNDLQNDLVVTASHCVKDLSHCKKINFVFDFAKTEEDQKEYLIPLSSVYSCKDILVKNPKRDDFAVIRLDRPVRDRPPLQFNLRENSQKYGEKFIVIGHPSGLPVKITEGSVIGIKISGFLVSADAFSGSSGSPVINPESGAVEGLLVSGSKDYTDNGSCQEEYLCGPDGDNDCPGELITPISKVVNSIPKCFGLQ